MRKLPQSILGGGDEEHQQDDLLDEPEGGLCSLSPTQLLPSIYFRVYGFAACLLAGLVCMFLSMIVFIKPIKFALLFTFGNMLAVGRWVITAFLIGPGQQIRMMLDPVRIYATAIYVGCVVIALICALLFMTPISLKLPPGLAAFIIPNSIFFFLACDILQIHSKILTIIAIICEICALIWYSLSYIPFARRIVSELTVRLFDTES